MALKYSSKYDISYINYNNKNIPWQINSSFISQNNQNINPSLNLGSINNNLLIESSQNDIVLRTPQNKKVIVNNSININTDLDVSNNLTTSEVVVEDISVNNILYLPSLPINIIGNLKVHGAISVVNSTTTGTGLVVSKSEFTNVTLTTSNFTDVSIVNCDISVSDFSNVNIINSYIYGIPIGYDKSNNRVPNGAIFSDISLENLILDSSLNGSSYINFSNIIIKSSDDYSKLEISKPLNVELKESVTNISNISLFNGDISCNTLYYSQLFPDIRLNNYIDISIGHVSVSGDIIPSLNNSFNLGSSNNKFNTITSTLFIGELSGTALLANDLVKNLDMSFNTLDVYGTVTLNKKSLAQFVSGDLITNVAAEVSFNNVNNNVTDLSRLLYSKQSFDLCLNTTFAKRSLLESSFINLNNNITTIANNVYIKSDFDLCLNRNFIRTSDVSAVTTIVSSPSLIYPSLINLNSSLVKVVNANVSNELAFPYAITYIDDNVEDTNIKEAYSYRKTTLTTTFNTTTTQTTTINYSYSYDTVPADGAEPNNLSETRLTMWAVGANHAADRRRTWNDVGAGTTGPAVYRTSTYEFISTRKTWLEHEAHAIASGKRLATIINAAQHAAVISKIPSNTNGAVYIGGRRLDVDDNLRTGTSAEWYWTNGDPWNYTNWGQQYNEPNSGRGEPFLEIIWWLANGNYWNDAFSGVDSTGYLHNNGAIYMTNAYIVDNTQLTWDQHKTRAETLGHELVVITNATQNEAVGAIAAASLSSNAFVFIGGRRKSNSANAYGITSADWEWHNGATWSYTNFYRGGQTQQKETRTESSPIVSTPQTGQATQVSTNTQNADTNLSLVKLPLLTASANGSIVALATAINVPSIPSNTSSNTSANPVLISDITTGPVITRANSITTNTKIHSYTTTNITYSLNSGSTSGLFNIYNNSNNNSSYIKSSAAALPSTITTSYSCIAITNDGMFVALGKASDVTVYMRNSTGWSALGSPITINFSAYTESSTGIIPTQFTENWRKNLQNLAINYISGENQPRIFLAFGDTRNSVKVYSYDNGIWTFPNGFYSVTTGSWVLKHTHLASTLGTSNNFGYFVVLSHNPRILVFTIDDRFYSYNCSDNVFTSRGSNTFIRLPTGVTNFTNIIALKITADADKVIVSNTHYVFVYKWNTSLSSWNEFTRINLVNTNITFNYGSSTNIPAGPRSLDISNISSNNNDCVFAIGFPDKIITSRTNNNVRGYVEYWNYVNSKLTKLATLVPRKRDITNNNVDSNEYFFSAGGIKITNANTILVSPNYKFHFNSTNKIYEYNSTSRVWNDHSNNVITVTGRRMASIENEVEQELVRINARNNQLWLGGRRRASSVTANGTTSVDWEWSSPDTSWNYVNWNINEPNNVNEKGLHFTSNGTWNDLGETASLPAMYMTRSLSNSLNTFVIFDKFFFHSSGFFSSYFPTDISNSVIARWATTDTPLNRSIEIRASGQLFSRSYGALSDIRLKENIVDISPKLEDLLKVRVVNYNLKGCQDANATFIGVVAQELEQIFPALVKDGDLSPQDINLGKTETYKYVKYSCFDIMLIKAFQEQMDIINKLSYQVDELETKTKLLKTIRQHNVILNEDLDFLKRENDLLKEKINIITMLMTK